MGHEMNLQMIDAVASRRASDVNDSVSKAPYPKSAEAALIHPLSKATVKLRDNGMIDIFATDDNGIRVDPATKTINFMTNGIKEHTAYHTAWLGNYTANIEQNWTVNVKGAFNVNATGPINLKSSSHIALDAPRIDSN